MTSPTHTHHHADDLLDDYLLGTLSAEESKWLEAHLEQCLQCQVEFESLLGAVQALPLSAPEPAAPMNDDVWDRIERSISTVPEATTADRPASNVRTLPPSRGRARMWVTIAALMLVSLVSGAVLAQVLPFLTDDGPEAQRIAVQFTDPDITASGELRYLPEEEVFVLELTGLPEPPEGHVYQAWLIDENAPIPVGVVEGGSGELASAGDRDQFQTFAITVEEGPLGNPAPTSDPVLVAPLHATDES